MSIQVVVGDITKLTVDAIVNAANERMLGGGGVDGAIHGAAGPELLTACRAIAEVSPQVRCPTGEARATPAFRLPARYVFHTVGPVWQGGGAGEERLLRACYRSCFELAKEYEVSTIAFPAISCGVFGYPLEAAARVAHEECRGWAAKRGLGAARVLLVAFDEATARVLRAEGAAGS